VDTDSIRADGASPPPTQACAILAHADAGLVDSRPPPTRPGLPSRRLGLPPATDDDSYLRIAVCAARSVVAAPGPLDESGCDARVATDVDFNST